MSKCQVKTIYEHGKLDYADISDCFNSEDFSLLERFLLKNKLSNVFDFQKNHLKAKNHVGVVKYKNYQFEILPKFLAHDGDDKEIVLKNLFHMLKFTKRLQVQESTISSLSKSNNPFLEVLISSYTTSLLDGYLKSVPKNYKREEDNLNFIKGKLNFNGNIKQNICNKAKFHCVYDEFCEDIALNQAFLFVTIMLKKITTTNENQKKLKFIENILIDVSFKQIDFQKAKKIVLSRTQKTFEYPFELALMFLGNSSFEMSGRTFRSLAIVWDMNKLFEEFIFRFMKTNKENLGIAGIKEKKGKMLFKDSANLFGESLEGATKIGGTELDILVSLVDGPEIIFDAKYKMHDGERNYFAPADVYQMVAYESLHNTNQAVLIYPQIVEEQFMWKHKLNSEKENKFIYSTCIDLRKDLKAQNEKLTEQLKKIFMALTQV